MSNLDITDLKTELNAQAVCGTHSVFQIFTIAFTFCTAFRELLINLKFRKVAFARYKKRMQGRKRMQKIKEIYRSFPFGRTC